MSFPNVALFPLESVFLVLVRVKSGHCRTRRGSQSRERVPDMTTSGGGGGATHCRGGICTLAFVSEGD